MDEFGQTRQEIDFFEDDFTPAEEPSVQPPPQELRNTSTPRQHHARAPPPFTKAETTNSPSNAQPSSSADVPAQTPHNPATPSTPSAVRGNRLATGGLQKPKLTEDELSERMEAVKLNNARRTEAHRLAEADEASYQQREAQAAQKYVEQGKARRAMDKEREKNRLRKLGAQGGREWDEGKQEEDFVARGPQYRRGANGGISEYGGRGRGGFEGPGGDGEYDNPRDHDILERRGGRGRGRGRGKARGGYNGLEGERNQGGYDDFREDPLVEGRGGRGQGGRGRGRGEGKGRGRGRGGFPDGVTIQQRQETKDYSLNVPVPDDFPALPSATTQGSWADQVEEQKNAVW